MKRGLTLIEILVVTSIIFILTAILFPVFLRSTAMAKRVDRLSRLKQNYLALQMYRESYDGKVLQGSISPGREWVSVLEPYIGSPVPTINPDYSGHHSAPMHMGNGFSMNSCILGVADVETSNPVAFFETASLENTGNFIALLYSSAPDEFSASIHPGYHPIGGKFLASHDNQGSLYTFWDGSIVWKKYSDVRPRVTGGCEALSDDKAFFENRIVHEYPIQIQSEDSSR